MVQKTDLLSLDEINKASERLQGIVQKTPLEFCQRLSDYYKAQIYLKREDLQVVRSFKIRGAYNFIASLTSDQKKKGVVCSSAGNHAQGVAFACAKLQVKGVIFMPVITPNQKIQKVRKFAGEWVEIRLVGATFDEASQAAQKYQKDTKSIFVHPFDHPKIMAGAATIAKEIDEQLDKEPDFVIAAIGGGGLSAGIASFFHLNGNKTKTIGVEADTQTGMYNSIKNGKVTPLDKVGTFVDGTAVKTVGEQTFKVCRKLLDEIVLVSEGRVCANMIELYQNEGIIVEPAGALAVSALDKVKQKIKGKKVVCVICGGNNDIARYSEIIERSLIWLGRRHYFVIDFVQKPGELKRFVLNILGPQDDIIRFEYMKKTNKERGAALVGVEFENKSDVVKFIDKLNQAQIKYKNLNDNHLLYDLII